MKRSQTFVTAIGCVTVGLLLAVGLGVAQAQNCQRDEDRQITASGLSAGDDFGGARRDRWDIRDCRGAGGRYGRR